MVICSHARARTHMHDARTHVAMRPRGRINARTGTNASLPSLANACTRTSSLTPTHAHAHTQYSRVVREGGGRECVCVCVCVYGSERESASEIEGESKSE
eukprot:350335-Pleurochrysis_carterae.AAC.1